jgi:hypothetical protein
MPGMDGSAEQPIRFGIHQHFHETLGLAPFSGAPYARHGYLADEGDAA